jgi:hypothetical protein
VALDSGGLLRALCVLAAPAFVERSGAFWFSHSALCSLNTTTHRDRLDNYIGEGL